MFWQALVLMSLFNRMESPCLIQYVAYVTRYPHVYAMISILLINPNSSASVTDCIARSSQTSRSDVQITMFQAPANAPKTIDNFVTSVLSAAACFPILHDQVAAYDGFIVACYSDHPLVHMLREGDLLST